MGRLIFQFHCVALLVSLGLAFIFPYLQEKYSPDEFGKSLIFGASFASFVWIFLAVLIGPVHVIITNSLPSKKWVKIRGLSGIWASLLLAIHLFFLWKLFYNFSLNQATRGGTWFGWLEAGILHGAFLYVVFMGVTSNDFSRRFMGRSWKRIHRGIYILFPAIAAAGAFEMSRIQTHWFLIAVAVISGVGVPILQLVGRSRLSK